MGSERPSGPHHVPPPTPVDRELNPEVEMESALLSLIGTSIAESIEATDGVRIEANELVGVIEKFKIVPPILLKIIPLNAGTSEPVVANPMTIAQVLSEFIYEITRYAKDSQARGTMAGMFFECSTFDQLDEKLADIFPEKYGNPNSQKPNEIALDYTAYYFKCFGPVTRKEETARGCYIHGPRFVASRWVDERNADIALAAFYEQATATGLKALGEISGLMGNARGEHHDPSFGGFDFANFRRFKIEKKKLPPDGICRTESWAVTVSW